MKQLTFVKACMEFFGRKPDQTPGEFAIELRKLDDARKALLFDTRGKVERALDRMSNLKL